MTVCFVDYKSEGRLHLSYRYWRKVH